MSNITPLTIEDVIAKHPQFDPLELAQLWDHEQTLLIHVQSVGDDNTTLDVTRLLNPKEWGAMIKTIGFPEIMTPDYAAEMGIAIAHELLERADEHEQRDDVKDMIEKMQLTRDMLILSSLTTMMFSQEQLEDIFRGYEELQVHDPIMVVAALIACKRLFPQIHAVSIQQTRLPSDAGMVGTIHTDCHLYGLSSEPKGFVPVPCEISS